MLLKVNKSLESYHTTSSHHEFSVFNKTMPYPSALKGDPKIIFFTDFDGTITLQDSMPVTYAKSLYQSDLGADKAIQAMTTLYA